MKKFFTLAALLTLSILSTSFKDSEWFNLKADGYEIAFPAQPKAQTNKVPSEIGELTMSMNIYDASNTRSKDDNLVYLTNSTDYPAEAVSSDLTEKLPGIFRGAIDGAVRNVEGKLLSEKEISLNGFPGREFTVDFQSGMAIITARCYLVKNRMYIVQVITETKKAPNAAMKRFFESFKIAAQG